MEQPMKVRLTYSAPGMDVDEVFTGATAEDVALGMKRRGAAESGLAVRFMIGSMSALGFAQEVVRRFNKQKGKSLPIPSSCDEFLKTAESEGIVQFLET